MFSSPAFAQASGAASAGGYGSIASLAIPWILILGIFYLLVWRPQSRQQKAHRERIAGAKKGDTVVTGGGFIGKVVRADAGSDEVELELGPNVRVRALKSTLTEVRGPSGKPAND